MTLERERRVPTGSWDVGDLVSSVDEWRRGERKPGAAVQRVKRWAAAGEVQNNAALHESNGARLASVLRCY